ncbi:MAG: hypothetical protein EHM19_00415 [Candidatus Latescibacterota bacterium]|nr:MAG: hypothetical protein EHM19_00415 [Candidatus Latescibacterota bacterium]
MADEGEADTTAAAETTLADTTEAGATVGDTTAARDSAIVDSAARDSALAGASPAPAGPPVPAPLPPIETPALPELDARTSWSLPSERLAFYAPRSFADAAAALPIARADRFGPPAYFETVRPGGTGAPLVVVGGIAWPRDAGGLPNAGAIPRAGVDGHALATPRVLPELALSAPGGLVSLEEEPWEGGAPRSHVAAERGADGYRDYRFGLARDLPRRLAFEIDGQFRKADAFAIDSYRAFSTRLRLQARIRRGLLVRAGLRRYADDQFLLDSTLRNRFSHEASDERTVLAAELLAPGLIGQAYRTRIHSDASALSASFASATASDERDGLRVTRRSPALGGTLTVAIRAERRRAEADAGRREAWSGALGAGFRRTIAPSIEGRAGIVGDAAEGEKGRASAEASVSWEGFLPGIVRAGRAWEDRTVRRWIENEGRPGVFRYGEVSIEIPLLPSAPSVRVFRREGDNVDYLYSIDAFRESSARIDERTDGLEISSSGGIGALEWNASYARLRARERGEEDPLPYQSEHLARGRLSYARRVPYLPAVPRVDLLGEWRSDRRAPDRATPMEDYYYLRGRVTVNLRGTDLFAQMEQVLGHQNEYIDGAFEGTDGVLSGSRQVYVGLYWPFMD